MTSSAWMIAAAGVLGSLFGSFAGGLLLGVAEAASVVVVGGAYREAVGLLLFLVILLTRPSGLFGGR